MAIFVLKFNLTEKTLSKVVIKGTTPILANFSCITFYDLKVTFRYIGESPENFIRAKIWKMHENLYSYYAQKDARKLIRAKIEVFEYFFRNLTLLSLGFFDPCKSGGGGGLFVPAVYISWSTYGFFTKLGQCLHWSIIFTIIKKKLTWRHFCHLLTIIIWSREN